MTLLSFHRSRGALALTGFVAVALAAMMQGGTAQAAAPVAGIAQAR